MREGGILNGKRAKKLRHAAAEFIKGNPDQVKPEGKIQVTASKVVMCNPRGPRSIYKAVKKRFGGRNA
jgi:hypothetical protein